MAISLVGHLGLMVNGKNVDNSDRYTVQNRISRVICAGSSSTSNCPTIGGNTVIGSYSPHVGATIGRGFPGLVSMT